MFGYAFYYYIKVAKKVAAHPAVIIGSIAAAIVAVAVFWK